METVTTLKPIESILDQEFPETVWDWGEEVTGDYPGVPEGSSIVYPSLEVAIAAGAPDPTECTFYEALNDALAYGDDWLVIADEHDNEIARYPTR